ncbi:MAG: hypothetical protein CMC08_04555 [Flavobacteriaceae bacterium]|nr:hypothetical protein [Flavobacteriaceae bacterium]
MRIFLWICAMFVCHVSFSQDPDNRATLLPQIVDEPPRAPGCATVETALVLTCTQNSLDSFVRGKFNTALFRGINLNEKRIRTYSVFTITETGAIESISVRTSHPVLTKEMERVLALLPRFLPAKHEGIPVAVQYVLPIIFTLG